MGLALNRYDKRLLLHTTISRGHQPKSPKIVCTMKVVCMSLFDIGISFVDYSSLSHLRCIDHKTYKVLIFMLNG